MSHYFTVDVEEYFQVSAFETSVPRSRWDSFESRVRGGVDHLLDMLERHKAHGTFFTLGWIAERHPGIVRAIAEGGHEIASHGYDHRKVTDLTEWEFRESIRRSKAVLEEISGCQVVGFRAPSFSITQGRACALATLVQEGYTYD